MCPQVYSTQSTAFSKHTEHSLLALSAASSDSTPILLTLGGTTVGRAGAGVLVVADTKDNVRGATGGGV